MSFGFRFWNGPNAIPIDSNSLALLYIDDFTVTPAQGTVSKTYAGLGSANLTVVSAGSGVIAPGATITQSVSGSDKVITVKTTNNGRFRVMME